MDWGRGRQIWVGFGGDGIYFEIGEGTLYPSPTMLEFM